MSEQETFAYAILSCSRMDAIHSEIRADWSDSGCSDIVECFISLEDQADAGGEIWPFDWDEFMDRVAPAQLTLGWDPRKYLLEVLQKIEILPSYQAGNHDGSNYGHIIYFDQLPCQEDIALVANSAMTEQITNPSDRTRFIDVLTSTVDLANSQNRGLLFVGCWGFDYQIDAQYLDDKEVKLALERHGMKFFTRHL